MTLDALVQDPTAQWTRKAPAGEEVIALLGAALPDLPPDYLAFLRLSNGGQGDLGVQPFWFVLWPAEEVAEMNADYMVPEFLPGFVAFGSDGGDEMLAFGAAPGRWGRVYAVPFVPMEEAGAREIAPDFATLAHSFGRAAPAA